VTVGERCGSLLQDANISFVSLFLALPLAAVVQYFQEASFRVFWDVGQPVGPSSRVVEYKPEIMHKKAAFLSRFGYIFKVIPDSSTGFFHL
jgi:hypothetical protein